MNTMYEWQDESCYEGDCYIKVNLLFNGDCIGTIISEELGYDSSIGNKQAWHHTITEAKRWVLMEAARKAQKQMEELFDMYDEIDD